MVEGKVNWVSAEEVKISASWFLWGAGYYLYYPFLSIYLVRFFPEDLLGYFFLLLTAVTIPLPLVGSMLAKLVGPKIVTVVGMILSGTGIILMYIANSFVIALIYMLLYYCFFLSLPNYYYLMRGLGEGVLSRVWAISIIPSIALPAVGGILASLIGVRVIFLIAGLLIALSSLPIIFMKEVREVKKGKRILVRSTTIPFLVVIPISLTFPYIYLLLKLVYGFSYYTIGIFSTFAELLGFLVLITLSYFRKSISILSIVLLLFSSIVLVYVIPDFSIMFGLWEVLIPLSIEVIPPLTSIDDYALVTSIQQGGWFVGYIIDSAVQRPNYAIIGASFVSICIGLTIIVVAKKWNI
ncbi:hypothetical protein HS7_04360 [Sulfolobales archaeon HS-7]|nr:hypothetical protein HS7_04360 [Sulfolobales archaeon HS-7]